MKKMPLSMKIQPIDTGNGGEIAVNEAVKPVVRSRLKRLFRISVSEPPATVVPAPASASAQGEVLEPSSVCLAKMVQNFIEESTEKPSHGRNRCNCFNGNGSDGSDVESDTFTVSSSDVCDFLKSLVVCGSKNERNVLAETARIVAEKKTCKRKDELRKFVIEGLIGIGYDAAICKSKWDKSSSFPAGEYEYVDVIIGGERLIIDIDMRSEFEVARSTKTYKSILQTLPYIFVGKSERLSKIITILSEAAKQSLKKKGMHIPPWRKTDYVQAKWLSPPTRIASATATPSESVTVTPPPTPLSPTSGCLSPDKDPDTKLGQSSPSSESIFDMSESSGEEDVKDKDKEKEGKPKPNSEIGVEVEVINGLGSIMEEKL